MFLLVVLSSNVFALEEIYNEDFSDKKIVEKWGLLYIQDENEEFVWESNHKVFTINDKNQLVANTSDVNKNCILKFTEKQSKKVIENEGYSYAYDVKFKVPSTELPSSGGKSLAYILPQGNLDYLIRFNYQAWNDKYVLDLIVPEINPNWAPVESKKIYFEFDKFYTVRVEVRATDNPDSQNDQINIKIYLDEGSGFSKHPIIDYTENKDFTDIVGAPGIGGRISDVIYEEVNIYKITD